MMVHCFATWPRASIVWVLPFTLLARGGIAQVSQIDNIGPTIRYGAKVPADVEQIYERGLRFLAQTQLKDGSWTAGQPGGAITGLCLMSFLARGEDPNFGRYSQNVRRAARNIIQMQDASSGFIQSSMYHHGFGMLALAEAYGAVDELLLWGGQSTGPRQRSIGEALELAVRCAVTSQKKSRRGGWRYSPNSGDADTSVSGAVLMGLLAARNAGIEVPDKTVDGALAPWRGTAGDSRSPRGSRRRSSAPPCAAATWRGPPGPRQPTGG